MNVKAAVLRVVLVPLALAAFGMFLVCGTSCSASQRERTIKTTLVAVNETRAAFVTFDRTTQAAIVELAPTYERGAAALIEYRKKREIVIEAFAIVYRAIATAATVNDDPSIATMLAAAKQIADAFHHLKQEEHAP